MLSIRRGYKNSLKEDIIKLNDIIDGISRLYFRQFADLHPKDETESKAIIQKILRGSLEEYIRTASDLNKGEPSTQAAETLRIYFKASVKWYSFPSFLELLELIFSRDEKKLINLWILDGAVLKVIQVIAYAIQSIVIAIPSQFYSGIKRVPDEVKECLNKILCDVDIVKQKYDLAAPLLDKNESIGELNVQIARTDGFIWLSFKPLVTAPLLEKDLEELYARNTDAANNLARQIVGSDGVILVTGYRGVGKSTFVNAALSRLRIMQQQQTVDDPWYIIPIYINVAKASTVLGVLRLCVRALHQNLLIKPIEPEIVRLLTEEEKDHITWASLRASYKVNLERAESVATLRQLQTNLDLRPANLLPKGIDAGVLSSLPTFSLKASKEWNKKLARTIALLDYDENQAEEDIINLIKLFSEPRFTLIGRVRLKLVFIFDEMDKLEKDVQLSYIKELKSLFLTRHTVFLLVSSKEFYYFWLKERRKEDAVLNSYFSFVVMVPLFTATETEDLLKRLILTPTTYEVQESVFVTALARYLTYRAKGIPREIISELQKMQQWLPISLQTHITDTSNQKQVIQAYADIQRILEELVDGVTKLEISPMNDVVSPKVEVKFVPEYVLLNQGRREQIKRGLYVFVEELLDQGSLEIDLTSDSFKQIYDSNFTMLSSLDFSQLVGRLATHLEKIHIEVSNSRDGTITPFSLKPPEEDTSVQKLVVSEAFYKVTGRSRSLSLSELEQPEISLSTEQITDLLYQINSDLKQERKQWKKAFEKLRRIQKQVKQFSGDISGDIYERLYQIVISEEETAFRIEAARYLNGNAFFENAEKQPPDRFIEHEENEQLLEELIRLVRAGASNDKYSSFGTDILCQLLKRHRRGRDDQNKAEKGSSFKPLQQSILTDAISILGTIAQEDILEQVVKSLDPNRDLNDLLLQSLIELAAKSKSSLIELLITSNFSSISSDALQRFLRGQSYEQLIGLWSRIISKRQEKLVQQVLIVILQQLPETKQPSKPKPPEPRKVPRRRLLFRPALSPQSSLESKQNTVHEDLVLENVVIEWLVTINWSAADQSVLKEAMHGNPRLLPYLRQLNNKPKYSEIRTRLTQAALVV